MNDPVWQEQYRSTFNDEPNIKRYQDLGTLELQIQLIRKYMSWIDQIFVVVSTSSQIKKLDNVVVITHDQIIPKEYLPTFNSCTIELFLHKIPGLSDYFIYFNDDIFPIDYISEEEFYLDRPRLSFKTVDEPPYNIFRYQCKNSSNLARTLVGLTPTTTFIKPDHICLIHSRGVYEKIWGRVSKTLSTSITPRRDQKNYNQYLFVDYLYYGHSCDEHKLNYMYIPFSRYSTKDLQKIITQQQYQLICVQDDIQDNEHITTLQDSLRKLLNIQ